MSIMLDKLNKTMIWITLNITTQQNAYEATQAAKLHPKKNFSSHGEIA